MRQKTIGQLRDAFFVLAILAGLAWWQQARIRYYLGLSPDLKDGVSRTVATLGQAQDQGDFDRLYGLMSAEYQTAKKTRIDRMKSILLGGTEAEKKEVRAQLAQLGLTEDDILKGDAARVVAGLVAQDVKANPAKFPATVDEVLQIHIDRDQAQVLVRTKTAQEATLHFVKQSGVWKLEFE